MDHQAPHDESPPHQPPKALLSPRSFKEQSGHERERLARARLARVGEDLLGKDFEQILDESLSSLRAQLVMAHWQVLNPSFAPNEVASPYGQWSSNHVHKNDHEEHSLQLVTKWGSLCEKLLQSFKDSPAKEPAPDWVLHRVWVTPADSQTTIGALAQLTGFSSQTNRSTIRSTVGQQRPVYSLGTDLEEEEEGVHFLDYFVAHPESFRRYLWALVGTAFLTYDAVTIPMELVGLHEGAAHAAALGTFIYWVVDLVFQMFVGYHENGVVEMKFLKASRRYLHTWCVLDVTILIIDFFFLIVDDIDYLRAGKGIRMVRNVRMLRLARVGRLRRLGELINSMSSRIFSEYVAMLVKISQLIILLVAVNHYIACMWYGLGTTGGDETWLTVLGLERERKPYLYGLSLHWSLTQFAPATNNIAPQNFVERLFAVGVVMFALVYFSSFISSVTNSVNQLKMFGQDKLNERSRIREFITRKTLTIELGSRIQVFFDKQYAKVKRPLREEDINFFKNLPETLRIKMHEEMFLPLFIGHHPFQAFSKVNMDLLIAICHVAIAERHFIPQEDVFVQNMPAHKVRIVVQGELDYIMDETLIGQVSRLTWISEQALYVHWIHSGKLTAETLCEFAQIDCELFHRSVAQYGGAALRRFQLFANFFASLLESVVDEGRVITDIDIGGAELDSLAERSLAFQEKLAPLTFTSSGDDEKRRQIWFKRATSMAYPRPE